MIRTSKKNCLWAMTATFGLLSALNIGSLHAADITWHPGIQIRAGAQKTETVANGNHQLTSNGYAVRGYVLIGWSERRKPLVASSAAQNRIQPLYRVGETIDIQGDKTLYAVWAIDHNGNGTPDYLERAAGLKYDPEYIRKILADSEARKRAEEASGARRNLRSAAVSLPAWDINDDLLAYHDHVYAVGCLYNQDTIGNDVLLRFPDSTLRDRAYAEARHDVELVFEYGGVFGDSAIVGGKKQKRLSRLQIPAGASVTDTAVFGNYPMMIADIKEEGVGTYKMYFVKKKLSDSGPDTLADANDFKEHYNPHINLFYEGRAPFIDDETGELTDTARSRVFQVYYQPEFASTTIRSRVSYRDTMRLNYGHLRGMPTKYMMRSLDGGWNWHPADSPLTDVERDLLQDDSVRVCLRALDEGVAWAAYLKKGYLDPVKYPYDNNTGGNEFADYRIEYTSKYYWGLYDALPGSIQTLIRDTVSDSSGSYYPGVPWSSADKDDLEGQLTLLFQDVFSNSTPFDISLKNALTALGYPGSIPDADQVIERDMRRDFNTVFGKRMADKVAVPPRCHEETYCFYVKRDAPPVHQRSVFIPTVEGVTVVSPGVGYTSIPSQKNFTFRVKYAGEPMTVTAKRLIDGRTVEVLTGTLNADGEYEYVIRRVMQDLTLEFTKTVANTLVDQPSVWANSGAVRIHAPKETTVRIYSASGVLVKQATVQGDKTVPLSAGLYLVVLSDGTTQKVLVQ